MPLNSPQSTCLPNPVSNVYLANLNAIGLASIFSTYIDHLALPPSLFSELQDLLLYIASLPHDLVLMGDFNLHIESSSSDVRQLTDILESFDLNQHVNCPTHIHGHSLGFILFFKWCDVLSVSPSDAISDHFSVIDNLKIPRDHSHTVSQTITYRKLKAIIMEAFKADIKNSDLIKNPKSNATELAQQYDSVLNTLINFHAQLATKKDLLKTS